MRERSSSLSLTAVLAFAVASAALWGCPPRRAPVIATTPGGTAPDARATSEPTEQPVEAGPEIRPIPGEGIPGEDIPIDPTGERSPLADIHFDFDQAALTDAARRTLENHAAWLQARRDLKVALEGHCDEHGTVDYNLALGDQRAQAARDYLVSLGVAADRLTTVSYGKERPLDPGHNEEAWARNRRVHFVVAR